MKILRPQKSYTWVLILFALLFVAFGLWSILKYHTVSAWPLTVACVLLVTILVLWQMPNSSYLLLDEYGLQIRHIFKTTRYRWNDIQKFWADRRVTGQMGVYYLLNGSRLMQVRYLPDNYGMKPRELAVLLNEWREHVSEDLEEMDQTLMSIPEPKEPGKRPIRRPVHEEEMLILDTEHR